MSSALDEVATFTRVVRHGSLAGAARELSVPKSTVSRRIVRLEEELGAELLHRADRRVVVTPAGKRLYDRVAGSVDSIELALRGTLDDAALPKGKIRMTAPPDFGRLMLIDELISFGDAFPEVSVELQLTDGLIDLAAEGFDLAIRAGRSLLPSAESLITRPLFKSSQKLAARPELADRVRCVDDLKALPFVLFRAEEMAQTLRLENASGRKFEVPVQGRYVVHDFTAMAELVSRGGGLGLMPAMHVERARAGQPLAYVLPHLSTKRTNVNLVYPSRRLPQRVKLLIEHLQRRISPAPRSQLG